jgi:hypothetical protein
MDEAPETPRLPAAAELLEADDETVEALIVEYVEVCLEYAPAPPFEILSTLPPAIQYVYSTALLEGEVESGGFNQYFYNSSSDYALEALQGYQVIGAREHARLLRHAIAIFHRERWFHFRIRLRRSLDAFFDSYQYTRLARIDEQFLEIDDDPVSLRADYIRSNLRDFARDS